MFEMRREKLIDERRQCVTLRAFFTASQEQGDALPSSVMAHISASAAHNGFALRVERQEPALAVRIYMQVMNLFRIAERSDWNAKHICEFTQAI
ncbi:hypothetical protein LPLAFNJD_LOCUS4631 [Methylorubrum aminovorans]